ncbi:MAG: hypothetical protein JO272_14390 [Pseudonocardiales bacterium]|nr:hypothetical protein [Pseudonocardiales bacterium]
MDRRRKGSDKDDRQRRRDNRLIAQWLTELDQHIEKYERKLSEARTPGFAELYEYNLAKSRPVREVIARGLDPKVARKFRGRVLLEVRCSARGHVLARVYPTSTFPVFIPSVSEPPAGRNSEKEIRFSEDANHAEVQIKRWNAIFKGTELEREGIRDEWLIDWSHSERHQTEVNIDIRGLAVLKPRHRENEVTIEGRPRLLSFQLLCRCGETWLRIDAVMEAIDAGQRVLAV